MNNIARILCICTALSGSLGCAGDVQPANLPIGDGKGDGQHVSHIELRPDHDLQSFSIQCREFTSCDLKLEIGYQADWRDSVQFPGQRYLFTVEIVETSTGKTFLNDSIFANRLGSGHINYEFEPAYADELFVISFHRFVASNDDLNEWGDGLMSVSLDVDANWE